MAIKIEEAFNDCYERLSLGESLDSCLRSYPEHAMELDFMLRTAFDVKRRVYPIQPRPEFKYWSRVRLQGVQDYMSRHVTPEKASPFNFRRNLAISVAGLLVLVIASSGTAAASNDALPDQPLYGVKMAVEQAQLTLAVSDVDKALLYANLAEKRAHEIEALARQGKDDYLVSTSAKMDYQLEQAETYISKYQAANASTSPSAVEVFPTTTSTTETSDQPAPVAPVTTPFVAPEGKPVFPPALTTTNDSTDQPGQTAPATGVKPAFITSDNKSVTGQTTVKRPLPIPVRAANVNKANTALNSSTAKSLATLQDALDKAPASARPALIKAIERVKKANEWSQHNMNVEQDQNDKPEIVLPKPNNFPLKPPLDANKINRDGSDNFTLPDRPRYIPPKIIRPTNPDTNTLKPPVTVPNTQIQVPSTQVVPKTLDSGPIQAPVIKNTINTFVSPDTREGDDDSSTIKGIIK